MQKCNPENYGLDVRTLTEFNQSCIKKAGFDGTEAGSYLNYYTNIYWLNKLYHKEPELKDGVKNIQRDIYIEGIGTENNKADSLWGMGLGNNDTGVIAKTDRAMVQLRRILTEVVGALQGKDIMIAGLQFDVFGFSRGAAAAATLPTASLSKILCWSGRSRPLFSPLNTGENRQVRCNF